MSHTNDNILAVNPKEAARRLGCSRNLIPALCDAGYLKYVKHGAGEKQSISVESIINFNKIRFSEDFLLNEFFNSPQNVKNTAKVTRTLKNRSK